MKRFQLPAFVDDHNFQIKILALNIFSSASATKGTRKREFLDEMSPVIPWTELLAMIAPMALNPRHGFDLLCDSARYQKQP